MWRFCGKALLPILFLASWADAALTYGERVQEYMLPNGLKVLLLEDHKAPVAVLQVWYRVGSRNETLGRTGLSHLMEHMMFKGTDKVGPEEYSKIIQRNGGNTNAFTSRDYTTYFATIARERIGVVIELEADRMANLVIRDDLYEPERRVVMEERRLRTEDSPVAALFEQINAAAYTAHPYGWPVIGWMDDLRNSTVHDIERHYRSYYVPNNATVIAVGDFEAEQLHAEIALVFGKIPSGEAVPSVRAIEPTQRGERRVVLRRPAQLPFIGISFHVPNLRSRDGAALEVLSSILSGGKSARLYRELVYGRQIARSVGTDYDYTSRDPGTFGVYGQPLPGKTVSELEQALLHELEKIRETPPSDLDLAKVKNAVEASFVFAQDSLFYQGMLLGQYESAGDWRLIDQHLPAIRAVTADDVQRVAAFYLTPENRTVGVLDPVPSPPATDSQPAVRPASGTR